VLAIAPEGLVADVAADDRRREREPNDELVDDEADHLRGPPTSA
jgi:hypothetical protein